MAAGSCTPRGSNGLVRNVHVLEVRVFEARTGKLLSGRRFPSRAAVKSGAGMSFTTVFNWVSAGSQTGFAGNSGGRKRPPPGGKLPTPAPADTANSAAPTRRTPINLPGTEWVGSEELPGYGPLRFHFVSSEQVLMYDAKEAAPGTWTLTGSSVTMRFFEGGLVFQGNVYSDSMAGLGDNGSERWYWRVMRSGRH
jgi:hypothetical protein